MPMPDDPNTPDPDSASLEAELIEQISRIAIRPHAYEDFMEKWNAYVGLALGKPSMPERAVDSGRGGDLENLSRHFYMGFRLLEELGRTDPEAEARDGGYRAGAASFLLDGQGRIVWYNSAASRHFGLRRISRIADVPMWSRSRSELARLLDALRAGDEPGRARTVLRLFSGSADKTLFMLAEMIENGENGRLIQVTQVLSGWHESVERMLADSFGLSEAETSIAGLLVEGADIAEIARRRASSVNTVRTQIKALLAKTGLNSRVDLVRILVALAAAADDAGARQGHVRLGRTTRFRQRNGRNVPFHRFGPENGRPFVFFHGMLDGCDLSARTVDLLHRHAITLFAPERPFFGSAAGDDGPIETAPERFARDVEDLLDHLGLARAGLVGHMAGSVYAFAAAARLGRRAEAIISVAGGVPIVSPKQFATMSPRQRLIAHTARHTPKLLPFVLRAGIRQLDCGGEERFMHALYREAPADLATITDPETRNIISAGYHFTVSQGHRAFEIDSYHVVRDWSARVDASAAPVLLIHGRNDPVVSIDSVERFARRLGERARLIIEEDAGQLLLYRNPGTVISAIAAMH